jgi:CheY-like chemotaxis protein
MKVLLVEDDHLQARWITDTLERAFPHAKIEPVRTEAEFYSGIDALANKPPNVIVMDVMLRWTDPAPDMSTPPKNVQLEGYRRAGLRCVEKLAEREDTKNIPVVLFTVRSYGDLESPPDFENVFYVSKESEPEELINRIRSVVSREQPQGST